MLEVVADMVGQCGSKGDARQSGEREKKGDHTPNVPTVTSKIRQVPTMMIIYSIEESGCVFEGAGSI